MPQPTLTRRGLIGSGTGAALAVPAAAPIAAFVAGCGDDEDDGANTSASADSEDRPTSGDEALDRLLAGNERFVADAESQAGPYSERRTELTEGQEPFAVVLGCSDSRVPPEVIFDQGLGELFTVRVAGNTVQSPAVVGSIEYAVAQLGSVLVMVLGHEECGAVHGAVDAVIAGAEVPGSIGGIIDPIVPVVEKVRKADPDLSEDELLEESIPANVQATIQDLEAGSSILKQARAAGDIEIVGAEYRLGSGEVVVL